MLGCLWPFFMFYRIFHCFLCLVSSHVTNICYSFKLFVIDPFEYLSMNLGKVFLAYLILLGSLCPFFLMFCPFFYWFTCLVSSYVTGFISYPFKYFVMNTFYDINKNLSISFFYEWMIRLGCLWPFFSYVLSYFFNDFYA